MNTINASIITIGDELLIGQTIDTNSAFIAQELNKIGVWIKRRIAVGDVWDDIWQALDEERKHSQIILITGGLGPTADDITKPLLCKYFGGKLVVNEQVLAHVKYLFEKVYRRPGAMLERNLKQAEVPDICTVLHNELGTAPGMWFESQAPLNLRRRRGTLESESSKSSYIYTTSDPLIYDLLKQFVKDHRSHPTEAENILWQIVRGRKMSGFKFRRQHIISNYIADFVCLDQKLIIEVDGLYHQLPDNIISDKQRTIELNKIGFDVLRFTNDQVLYNTDKVINEIVAKLTSSSQKEASESKSVKSSQSQTIQNPPLGGGGAVFISMPGVPVEMKWLMINEVIPRLKERFQFPFIIHKTAFTFGMGESMIAERIKDFEAALPAHIKLAYLPGYGLVKLRLTMTGDNREAAEKEIEPLFTQLKELVKDILVSDEDEGLEIVVGKELLKQQKTMSTAESCTGGNIAHLITTVPGSSCYFKGAIVSYANEAKENVLNVSHDTLMTVGAVSEETVKEMVNGALEALNTDYALATSGIMGPDGGSEEKPVGTVWIAAGNKKKTETMKLNLRFDRSRNIEQTSLVALNFLRKFIINNG